MSGNFQEKDVENLVEFLNLLATKSELNGMTFKDSIRFYGLLSWAQQSLLEKIKSNILEVVSTKELKPEEQPKTKSRSKAK